MELKSSSLIKKGKKQHTIESLFNINGAIRNVTVISAYVDIATVDAIIAFMKKYRDQRTTPHLSIYIDYSASGYTTMPDMAKELKRCATQIGKFCDEESDVYLVRTGNLFHSKCYLVQSNQQRRLILGSMNATKNGLGKNEELILSGASELTGNSYINRMAGWIMEEYLPRLDEKSDRISEKDEIYHYPSTMRQLLMDGWLYYELREQDPFRFPLHLPEEIIDQDSGIHPLLSAKLVDGISVISLIEGDTVANGLGHPLPEKSTQRQSWKRYCIETCYGHWSPTAFDKKLKTVLKKRINIRKPYYETVREILGAERQQVSGLFESLITELNRRIHHQHPNVTWDAFENGYLIGNWLDWYDRLLKKLSNKDQFERLVSGVSRTSVPDVWNDPLATDEFENSFLDSLKFYWAKSYAKKTSRIAAAHIATNLQIECDIDNEKLKKTIEKWCKTHRSRSIFEIK